MSQSCRFGDMFECALGHDAITVGKPAPLRTAYVRTHGLFVPVFSALPGAEMQRGQHVGVKPNSGEPSEGQSGTPRAGGEKGLHHTGTCCRGRVPAACGNRGGTHTQLALKGQPCISLAVGLQNTVWGPNRKRVPTQCKATLQTSSLLTSRSHTCVWWRLLGDLLVTAPIKCQQGGNCIQCRLTEELQKKKT